MIDCAENHKNVEGRPCNKIRQEQNSRVLGRLTQISVTSLMLPRPVRRSLPALLLLAMMLPSIVWAQSRQSAGTVQGTVLDITGAVLPGVSVTLSSPDSGGVRNTQTDDAGQFRFLALPIGSYTLRLQKESFLTAEVKP